MARAGAPEHAQAIDDLKDQFLLVLIRRLAPIKEDSSSSRLSIPVSEIDDTGGLLLAFSINDGVFNFELRKKQ